MPRRKSVKAFNELIAPIIGGMRDVAQENVVDIPVDIINTILSSISTEPPTGEKKRSQVFKAIDKPQLPDVEAQGPLRTVTNIAGEIGMPDISDIPFVLGAMLPKAKKLAKGLFLTDDMDEAVKLVKRAGGSDFTKTALGGRAKIYDNKDQLSSLIDIVENPNGTAKIYIHNGRNLEDIDIPGLFEDFKENSLSEMLAERDFAKGQYPSRKSYKKDINELKGAIFDTRKNPRDTALFMKGKDVELPERVKGIDMQDKNLLKVLKLKVNEKAGQRFPDYIKGQIKALKDDIKDARSRGEDVSKLLKEFRDDMLNDGLFDEMK